MITQAPADRSAPDISEIAELLLEINYAAHSFPFVRLDPDDYGFVRSLLHAFCRLKYPAEYALALDQVQTAIYCDHFRRS